MAITVTWGNAEKTYTVFRFEGKWTWDEYHQSIQDGVSLVKDCPYTVNILIDMTECRLFPQNLLSHFNHSMSEPPKPFDLAVIVTSSKFVEILAGMIERASSQRKTRFRVAKTLEQAHQMLAEHDAEHPPERPPEPTVEPAAEQAPAAPPAEPAAEQPPAVESPAASPPPPPSES